MSYENWRLGDRYFRFPIAAGRGAAREYGNGESGWIDYDITNMYTMDTTKRNDVAELTRLGLSTFVNIGQMARYRYLYTLEKELS